MKWARRVLVVSAIAATSLVAAPAVAGAAQNNNCYSGCQPPAVGSNVTGAGPSTSSNALPFTEPSSTPTTSGSSSLPFTGADIGELAAIGAGAVLVGGLLNRRRRAQA
jgi:hypothetical protein